ncbi:DUF397 domain-containing protein [Streptomyces xiamenensis]|uniref:DUF397 domain-containing protein n=1 Tax=Streptomyces xiamenensis TaxID=408015 RepID=A0A0F7FXY7_9ACTN|nr:DUF397 domain-containing protein [Streptomyces xiamenensis]AKG45583.1 protein of unknown function DUF397 [Streptomyces xiamenensis]
MTKYAVPKPSYSTTNGNCVEVATKIRTAVAVRDSQQPTGPVLSLAPAAWTRFLAGLS